MTYYYFECGQCLQELTAEVDLPAKIVDWSEQCENPDCNYKFTEEEVLKIYDDALADCMGSMIDYAHETIKDREMNL